MNNTMFFILFCCLTFLSNQSYSAPCTPNNIVVPSYDDDGNFVVSWSLDWNDGGVYCGIIIITVRKNGVVWDERRMSTGAPPSYTATNFSAGTYDFDAEVIYYDDGDLDETQAFLGTVKVYLGPGSTDGQRRVIFIHTDLLGSPAAETDESGNPIN